MKILYSSLVTREATTTVLKKPFLKISHNLQENTCAGVSYLWDLFFLLKKDSSTGFFLWIMQNF